MNKVIVIDVGFVMFRAILSFASSKNTIPMAYTFMRMLVAGLKRIGIDYSDIIILAKDSPLGSWRRGIFSEYKANRKKNREKQQDKDFWDEMWKEVDIIMDKINNSLSWHIITVDKAEADDVAGVVCHVFKDKEIKLYTADGDWSQLLQYPNVKLLSIITKKWIEKDNAIEVLNQKIEKGDKADNILGKPKDDKEREIRRQIISLIDLPDFVEKPITEKLLNLPQKNIYWERVPFKSIRKQLQNLYEGGKNV
ncbi:MAG: hypothetical protein V1901_04310 [Patescibacteria group bacterium]